MNIKDTIKIKALTAFRIEEVKIKTIFKIFHKILKVRTLTVGRTYVSLALFTGRHHYFYYLSGTALAKHIQEEFFEFKMKFHLHEYHIHDWEPNNDILVIQVIKDERFQQEYN